MDDFNGPCVVKVTHGANGNLVRFVNTRKEYEDAIKEFKSKIDNVELVVTELIPVKYLYFACILLPHRIHKVCRRRGHFLRPISRGLKVTLVCNILHRM